MARTMTYVASIAAAGGLFLRRTGLWSRGAPLPLTDAHGRRLPGSISEKPPYFLHGIHDYTCSLSLAQEYFERVLAPVKGYYTFDRSAHSPIFEEPEKVRRILSEDVLNRTTNLADPP